MSIFKLKVVGIQVAADQHGTHSYDGIDMYWSHFNSDQTVLNPKVNSEELWTFDFKLGLECGD